MDTQTPDTTSVIAMIGHYWGYLIAIIVGLGTVFTFYRKYCRGKYTAIKSWCSDAVNAPTAIKEMRDEFSLEGGLTFRQWAALVDDNLRGLRQLVSFETISRRNIWDSVDAPIFEAAIDGRFMWVNKAFQKMTDCDLQGLIGNNWRNVIAGPDRDEVIDGWSVAVRDGTDFKTKFRLATDSTEKWVRFQAICNKDDLGNVLRFTGKIWEIADPRQAGMHNTLG